MSALIFLQVTHFLYQSAESQQTVSVPLPSLIGLADPTSSLGAAGGRLSGQPATLFSNAHMRGEVAIQLLTCSQDIMEGFEFAREIIQVSRRSRMHDYVFYTLTEALQWKICNSLFTQAYRLSQTEIYCGTARSLSLKGRYGDLRILLQCLQKAHTSPSLYDEIIMAAIKVLANQPKEVRSWSFCPHFTMLLYNAYFNPSCISTHDIIL